MSGIPKCSVMLANYNYERYLPQAIQSVLDQDYPNVEVVVVDDGSTDGSHRVLEQYAPHIKAIRKANGGEASARNLGFVHSTGDVIILLDADDYLFPHAVSRVMDKFEPGVAKVHYPLEIVDAEGQSTGEIMARHLPSGDMEPLLKKFGFYPSPPTSGNAYARAVLERIFPMPERLYTGYSDTYEIMMAALYGEVRAIEEPCAAYRRHHSSMSKHDVNKLPRMTRRDIATVQLMNRALRKRGTGEPPRVAAWPQHLKHRLMVAKFLPKECAKPDDSVRSLLARYVGAVWRWPAYSRSKRVAATGWALMYAASPAPLLHGAWSDARRLTSLVYPLIK